MYKQSETRNRGRSRCNNGVVDHNNEEEVDMEGGLVRETTRIKLTTKWRVAINTKKWSWNYRKAGVGINEYLD